MDFDIDDIKPTALKRMLKAALLKNHKTDEKKKASGEDSEKEQEDLAELHGEKKGDSKPPKVENDDLPVEIRKVAMNEDDEDEDEKEDDKSPIDDAKKKNKKFPFKKKKNSFPFQKKKG
jgi:hypothetical protein